MTAPDPEGEGVVRAMRMALVEGGFTPADLGHLNAHGTGTPANDAHRVQGAASRCAAKRRALRSRCARSRARRATRSARAGAVEAIVTRAFRRERLRAADGRLRQGRPGVLRSACSPSRLRTTRRRWRCRTRSASAGTTRALPSRRTRLRRNRGARCSRICEPRAALSRACGPRLRKRKVLLDGYSVPLRSRGHRAGAPASRPLRVDDARCGMHTGRVDHGRARCRPRPAAVSRPLPGAPGAAGRHHHGSARAGGIVLRRSSTARTRECSASSRASTRRNSAIRCCLATCSHSRRRIVKSSSRMVVADVEARVGDKVCATATQKYVLARSEE